MNFQVIDGSFYYDSSRKLLDRVGFSVDEGDVLAILGPNGAGKTTLLKCMMGLLPWKEGSTFLDGSDIKAIPFRELWKTVAYVPTGQGIGLFLLRRGDGPARSKRPHRHGLPAL